MLKHGERERERERERVCMCDVTDVRGKKSVANLPLSKIVYI